MAQVTYDEVLRLAEQLTPAEQQALIAHLQELAEHRALTDDEWDALFDSLKMNIMPAAEFSLRRADWYDDDGR
ncbi:MAG: hypothetical protein K8J31_04640 [Anaerolineae bacterium]|nr:hypothetical protein [Anaerolineae bacterium]